MVEYKGVYYYEKAVYISENVKNEDMPIFRNLINNPKKIHVIPPKKSNIQSYYIDSHY